MSRLYLVRNGVPYDTAMTMDDDWAARARRHLRRTGRGGVRLRKSLLEAGQVSQSFASMAHLATHLARIAVAEHEMQHEALERCAKLVEKRAKAKLGEYQDAAGPFAGWAELADATKADRAAKGFPDDEPLLRTGALRDSIGHTVRDSVAQIGSDSDIAVYQELGTRHIPPRSFLGGAMAESLSEVKQIVGESAVAALVGKGVFNRRLGIE